MAKVDAIRVLWLALCNNIHYRNASNLAQGGAVYRQSLKT